MNRGLIELAALSPPDDEWILVEASSSMDAYEFGNPACPKIPFMTDKKKAPNTSVMTSKESDSMEGYDQQNKATAGGPKPRIITEKKKAIKSSVTTVK
jgi:hypothetical protein